MTVLDLRALVLHGHHDAGRNVGDTHRGIHEAEVEEHLVPEAGVQQVQHGVLSVFFMVMMGVFLVVGIYQTVKILAKGKFDFYKREFTVVSGGDL